MKFFEKFDDTSKAAWIVVTWSIAFDAALIFCTAIWWLIFAFVSIIHTMYLIYDSRMERMQKELDRKRKMTAVMFEEHMRDIEEYGRKDRKDNQS